MARRTSTKVLAILSSAALVAGAGTMLTTESAAAASTVTQTRTCTDGGGARWTVKSSWGKVYTDSRGVRRVQNNLTGFTTSSRGVTTVDYIIRTYNPDGRRIQDLRKSNRRFDFRRGAAYLHRNVRNPISGPGRTKIKVKLGDGGDGKSKCSVIFVQPGVAAAADSRSTPTPTTTRRTDRVWTSGYTWYDNDPPRSASIMRQVIHRTAGGIGSYADPVTLAVAHRGGIPQFAFGTRFYLPEYKKYFIVEDICGACWEHPSSVKYKIDLWLDGRWLGPEGARRCAYANTGATTAIKNPPRGLAVRTSRIC